MLEGLTVDLIAKVVGALGALAVVVLIGWLILRGAKALIELGSERARRESADDREKAVQARVEALLRTLPRGSALRRRWDRLRDERRPPAE